MDNVKRQKQLPAWIGDTGVLRLSVGRDSWMESRYLCGAGRVAEQH